MLVSQARLLNGPGQTEIRIELQAGALGGLELRAHVSGNQLNASIAAEHHATRTLLTTELPALHNTLREKDVRIDVLRIEQEATAPAGSASGENSGQRAPAQKFDKPSRMSDGPMLSAGVDGLADLLDGISARGRLSVLA